MKVMIHDLDARYDGMIASKCDRVIVTKNLYGGYGADVKNVLDRSIGTSTPLSTYRGRQMHHTLRYGKQDLWHPVGYPRSPSPGDPRPPCRLRRHHGKDGGVSA